jgi:hypothetical protein
MKKYLVQVTRTEWGHRSFEVEAPNRDLASQKAMEEAGNYEYTSHDSEYNVDYINEVKP